MIRGVTCANCGTGSADAGRAGGPRSLRRRAPGSDLVDAEAQQWRADAILSAVMVAGALTGFGLVAIGRAGLADYVDPVLVLVACAVLVPIRCVCCARHRRTAGGRAVGGDQRRRSRDGRGGPAAVRAGRADRPAAQARPEALRRGRLRRRAGRVGRQRGGRDPSSRRRRSRARGAGLWAYVELTTDRALVGGVTGPVTH